MRDVYKNHKKWQKKANTLSESLKAVSAQEYYSKFIAATGIELDDVEEEEFIL